MTGEWQEYFKIWKFQKLKERMGQYEFNSEEKNIVLKRQEEKH